MANWIRDVDVSLILQWQHGREWTRNKLFVFVNEIDLFLYTVNKQKNWLLINLINAITLSLILCKQNK